MSLAKMVKVRVGGSKLRQKAERRAKAQKQARLPLFC